MIYNDMKDIIENFECDERSPKEFQCFNIDHQQIGFIMRNMVDVRQYNFK